jgi:bifunctional DNA-binding transcriptional regulator/antitoxin component of YhaV-PrlF toxin-antitoxin module
VELKLKKYESQVLEILSNGDAVIGLPDELCVELNWNLGDSLNCEIVDGEIILKKLNGSESTN